MNFNNVRFERSFGTSAQLTPSTAPEVAFSGRSNVGKSSLLNKLFNRKGLAKVSQTPGKTATINFFDGDGVTFVDLPGYGYAKVSKSEKARWSELIEGYFNQDRSFALVVALVDIRHEASELDENMIRFLREADLPFVVALTKADKLSRQQQMKQKAALKRQLALGDDASMVVTSSAKGDGMEELRKIIRDAVASEPTPLRAKRKRKGGRPVGRPPLRLHPDCAYGRTIFMPACTGPMTTPTP